jgi:hypothetical protein
MAKLNSGTRIYGNVTIDTFATATGNITGGNILTAGLVSATGAVTGASLAGTITTAAQTNITSVGTLSSLSVTGNVQGGNLRTAGLISATGAVTAASVVGGVITGSSASVTGTTTAASVVGGVITGTSLTVSTGNITGGNIINANGNGVGNIGSSTVYFNTVFAKATSAQYADVAEKYTADADYPVGTVLRIGGMYEVSQTNSYHGTNIVGTVSDKPAYVMNSGLAAEHVAVVALLGRVPCRVTGTISKGDLLVSSETPGVATVLDSDLWVPGCVIGKALEDYSSTAEGTIEIVVGRA